MVMQWLIASQPSVVAVDNNMHELISLGVGHLKAVHEEDFNTNINYPVYIDEPLLILSIISILERRQQMQRSTWVNHALFTARN